MHRQALWGIGCGLLLLAAGVRAQAPATTAASPVQDTAPAGFDARLAASVGADEHGMRHYVLVILKTGPHRVPDGPQREAMFKGHFANIQRLAKEGKLAVAGPFDDTGGWRGMFVFAVPEIADAEKLVATDPVIANGEMVAEYHKLYASAALMLVAGAHEKIVAKPF